MAKEIKDISKNFSEYIDINSIENIDVKQDKVDNNLQTEDKTIVGAINELFQSANNGKELIANAIGEPLSAEDTFSAMSGDINNLLATFKANMMNNGVTVEAGDKFKSLIDKIATLADNEGKGIQYAEGTVNLSSDAAVTKQFSYSVEFDPTLLFVVVPYVHIGSTARKTYNAILSNMHGTKFPDANISTLATLSITNTTPTSFTITKSGASTIKIGSGNIKWYAIGVGEEDTALRDTLAGILQEEGVEVTEEDDMASLITKVDKEFDKQVVPAGTAVASNVLSGKTFINSTGQTITGTMTNRGSKTFTPSASKQTGAAGYYSGITVNTDSNLVAENIVSGVSIFGVTGTASSIKYATGSGPMVAVTDGFGISVSNLDFTPTHVYGYALYKIGSVTNVYVGSLVIVDGKCRAICYGIDSSFSYSGIKTNGFNLPLLRSNLSTVPNCTCYWTAIG